MRATRVRVTGNIIVVTLQDGQILALPLSAFPRLLRGTQAQRERFELIGGGFGIHWPDLDEDLSILGFLRTFHQQPPDDF